MPFDIKTQLRIQYEVTSGTWVSVQADSFEVDIDRGVEVESNTFARPSVGTASVRMMKSSLADFMNGPQYQSNMQLRIEYQAPSTAWISLFTGFIQNIEMAYVTENKKLQVTITANDMGRLALNTDVALMVVGSGSSRSFINVMNQLEAVITGIDSRYSASQALSGGSSIYQQASYVFEDTNSGAVYQHLLDAELGWLWANRDGPMYFHTRADVNTIQAQTWDAANLTVSNIHSNNVKHVCMDSIQLGYISDNIANVVRVTNGVTGVKTTSTNAGSVASYGRQLADFEVIFDGVSPSSTYAQWASAVATAANPKSFSQVSVPVITDLGEVSEIAQSEVGSALQVEFAATGFTTLQELYMISRINHTIDADHWEMNVSLWRGI
jgi:hypothetical protein